LNSVARTVALIVGAVVMLVAPLGVMQVLRGPDDPRISVGAAPAATLVPGDVRDATGRMLAGAVWTGLSSYDPRTGAPVPGAAQSLDSRDQRVWTVRLKPGGRFHDGSPVTARSFTGAWTAVVREGWAGARLLTDVARIKGATMRKDGIAGLRVTGDLTFEVTLDRPLNGFPALVAAPAFMPMPDSVLQSRDWASYGRRPIGNGLFRVAAHGPRETVLERPNGRTVVVRAMPDASQQYAAVESGDLDVATEVPADRHESMDTEFRNRHLTLPGLTTTYLAFPSWDERFTTAVRQALSLAINRNAITEDALGYQATAANALVPPGIIPGHRQGQCRLCLHDPRAATAALTDAGGFKGALAIWYEEQADAAWVEDLAEQLRSGLTIDVQPRRMPAAELRRALDEREVDGLYVVHSTAPYPAPVSALRPLLEAGTGYDADHVSDLIEQAESAPTPENGVTPARLAESAMLRDMPAMPLWTSHEHYVWSERARNVTADPFTGLRLERLSVED
jgi:oligopeptide transport system substrate-binding protein